jgi:hypothetical protein
MFHERVGAGVGSIAGLRILAGLRAEGTETTLVLWALTKALRDVWNAQSGGASQRPSWRGTPRWHRRSDVRRGSPSGPSRAGPAAPTA